MKREDGVSREKPPGIRDADFRCSSSTCRDRDLATGTRLVQVGLSASAGDCFHSNTYFLLTVITTECSLPSANDPPPDFNTLTFRVAPPTFPSSASTPPETR